MAGLQKMQQLNGQKLGLQSKTNYVIKLLQPVMALQKGGHGARKVRKGHYFLSQKKVAKPGFGV